MRNTLRLQDWIRVGKTLFARFAGLSNALLFLLFRQWPGVRFVSKI